MASSEQDQQQQHLIQSSSNPPAQPAYILRGHAAQIHAVHFCRGNSRLLTGDADGWVVFWSTATKRATAVWKAHDATVLAIGTWDEDKILTHGRDGKLLVWQLRADEEGEFSKLLPMAGTVSTERRKPWVLHALTVNSVGFCGFAMCYAEAAGGGGGGGELPGDGILVATPGVQDGHVNVTSLPDEDRIATVPSPQGESTGMTMAVGLGFVESARGGSGGKGGPQKDLIIVAGYEAGHAFVWTQQGGRRQWQLTYMSKPHSQPVLSLDIALEQGVFFTSSADAIVARHPLSESGAVTAKTTQTRHAGQQGLRVRDDGKIFATAGWEGRVRVYSGKTMKELAVLKWHNEGCYAIGFADVENKAEANTNEEEKNGDQDEETAVAKRQLTVSQQREQIARTTHWIAAGSKDGKVSLWDIY